MWSVRRRRRLASRALHDLGAGRACPRLHLRGEEHPVALALECLADRLLGATALVALGGVEVVDAALEGVAHQIRVGGATGAEGDVGDLEAGPAEAPEAANPRWRGGGPGVTAEVEDAETEGGGGAADQKAASGEIGLEVVFGHWRPPAAWCAVAAIMPRIPIHGFRSAASSSVRVGDRPVRHQKH